MSPSYRDYHFIVSGNTFLAQGNELPFSENPFHFWQSCEGVNRLHDIELTTLRCLRILNKEEDNLVCRLYAQEYLGGELPAGWSWRNREDIAQIGPPFQPGDLIHGWDSLSDTAQVQWYQLGFYEHLTSSFSLGREQVRSWERSSVWRLHQGAEKQYLKLIPPMFPHEIPLSAWLQNHFPQHSVQMVESPMGMLMRDYGTNSLIQQQALPIWEEALRVYAQIQEAALPHAAELRALGLPARSLLWVNSVMDNFFADEAMLRGGSYPLSAEDIAMLRAALPQLHQACESLGTFRIPETLEHGDLWAGQIIIQAKNVLITDWSDSGWTHPFFSLIYFLAEIHNDFASEPGAFESCKRAYLEQWLDHEPMPRLLEAFDQANLLSPLYTALRYYYDILPKMRQRWEMENMLSYNLRFLIKVLER